MGLPFASSSTSLSRYRMLRISGSSISSIRTPQMTPVILGAFGCSAGASPKKLRRARALTAARQPADDFVHLLPLAPFHFGFPDVVGIYAGEGSGEDPVLLHGFLR